MYGVRCGLILPAAGVPGDDQEAEVREVCGSEVAVLGSAFGISGFVVGLIVGALSAAVVTYKIMRYVTSHAHTLTHTHTTHSMSIWACNKIIVMFVYTLKGRK